jgi:hypothetical protein
MQRKRYESPAYLDTVEVCGSSPHGPTIPFNKLAPFRSNPATEFNTYKLIHHNFILRVSLGEAPRRGR